MTAWDIEPTIAPKNAPIPVVIPDSITQKITFVFDIPPFFIGTAIDIPSGISCKHIAIAKPSPKRIDASKPEPIANPSGKLWIANPIDTIIPVFNKSFVLAYFCCFLLNFFCTII